MTRPRKLKLPTPSTGYELFDLMWAVASPLASTLLEELQGLCPEPYWSTVSGAAVFQSALCREAAANRALHQTRTVALRRIRKQSWLLLKMETYQCSDLIWASLATKVREDHPDATIGQAWLLIRDSFRQLSEQLSVVHADGR